jgi:hypothetical protein
MAKPLIPLAKFLVSVSPKVSNTSVEPWLEAIDAYPRRFHS